MTIKKTCQKCGLVWPMPWSLVDLEIIECFQCSEDKKMKVKTPQPAEKSVLQ